MNTCEYKEMIRREYKDNNFRKVINSVRCLNKNLLERDILNIYINSELQLGMFEEASKSIELALRLYPSFYNSANLLIMYAKCGKTDEIMDYVKRYDISINEYYYLARTLYSYNNRELAKYFFEIFISLSADEDLSKKAIKFLDAIEKQRELGSASEMYSVAYGYFKSKGLSLSSGHIVHISKLRGEHKINRYRKDPKKEMRPYLIWKKEGNGYYAFPITSTSKSKDNMFLSSPMFNDLPQRLMNELVYIEERDISTVLSKEEANSFRKLLDRMYISLCCSSKRHQETTQVFINEMLKRLKVEKHNIIIVYDKSEKKRKKYFVVGISKQEYRVMEVHDEGDGSIKPSSIEISSILVGTPIIGVLHLSEVQISRICDHIPSNFRSNGDLQGKIIEYNSRRLEVMIEEDDDFICIDTALPFSPSFISIVFVPKNIPLYAIDKMPREEYERKLRALNDYIRESNNEFAKKKQGFMKSMKKH